MKSNGPRIFQLKRQLATISQTQNSVSHYFTKLKSVWDELQQYRLVCTCCTCGGTKSVAEFLQYEYLMNFLMGLNESYANTRAQLLLMDPPPSINRAFSLVNQEEQQRSIGGSSYTNTQNFALVVPQPSSSGKSTTKSSNSSKMRKERHSAQRPHY